MSRIFVVHWNKIIKTKVDDVAIYIKMWVTCYNFIKIYIYVQSLRDEFYTLYYISGR